jgi:hypothetical protein
MEMLYHVNIRISTEADFEDEIEAGSEQEAEQIAEGRIWEDSYTQELRACSEIVNEEYEAFELCEECMNVVEECDCEESEEKDFIDKLIESEGGSNV